jgi:hypothetical protein
MSQQNGQNTDHLRSGNRSEPTDGKGLNHDTEAGSNNGKSPADDNPPVGDSISEIFMVANKNTVSDVEFSRLLEQLRSIRQFLWQQSVPIESIKSFGTLNNLAYHPGGRLPSDKEWLLLEQQAQAVFSVMTPALRSKFLGTIPRWLGTLALYLMIVSLATIVGGLFILRDDNWSDLTILSYVIYVISLGATGSIAFIAMNALAVQNDITFDLLEERLLMLRIVLGSLFAVIFSLPFGYPHFVGFLRALITAETAPATANPTTGEASELLTTSAMLLVLPFLLGFSTTLVILIFNRLVGAVQSFFGAQQSAASATTTTTTVALVQDTKTGRPVRQ